MHYFKIMKTNEQICDIFLAEKSSKDENSERRKIPNQLPAEPPFPCEAFSKIFDVPALGYLKSSLEREYFFLTAKQRSSS